MECALLKLISDKFYGKYRRFSDLEKCLILTILAKPTDAEIHFSPFSRKKCKFLK